ncbi:MAG: endolytic transglycosylase MltG [Fimbriimonadaceae bacterium]|nr:endolytic transglycosylase MltG [Fimbriimonadaceae bacterium]
MKRAFALAAAGVLAAIVCWLAFLWSIRPTAESEPFFFRVKPGASVTSVLADLQEKGVIRAPGLTRLYWQITRTTPEIKEGTYRFKGGQTVAEAARSLTRPISRNVRIPEGWWIRRVAQRLEKENVCSAEDYIRLANDPARFQDAVDFPLPKDSLEGYLFPDTYDLPPLLGAEGVIRRQLRAFEQKVIPALGDVKDLHRHVVVGSMIELEAGLDRERPVISGVIANRLKKGMRLELDATVLYALQEWKNLGPGVVRTVKSPYNTYLNDGLPPGPIGSPGASSIVAAANPESHPWLFYVAKPDRTHLFSTTYDEHRRNIRTARAAWRAQEAREGS